MTKHNGMDRRQALKLGSLGAAALAGGAGPLMRVTFAEAADNKPIRVITSNSTLTHALLNVLADKGYMGAVHLEPQYLHVADNSKVVAALVSGQAELCTLSGFSLVFPAIEHGAKLKILGGAGVLVQDAVYTKDPAIKSIKDLAGHSIGTGSVGALTYQLMVAVLEKYGVDPKSVTFRNVGSNTDIFRAVVAGTVDAGPSGINVLADLGKYGVHIPDGGDLWKQLPNYVYQGAFAGQQAIDKKRDALVRTLAAFAKVYRFVQTPESKDVWLKAYFKASGKQNTKEALSQWNFIQENKPYSTDIVLSEDRLQFMQKLNVQLGIQKAVLPFDKVADMSLAKESAALLRKG